MKAKPSLHEAAKLGDVEQVRRLLAEGLSVDVRSEAGYTALQYAVVNAHLKAVRLLLDAGADVKARDGNGRSLLHSAVLGGGLQIMKLLLRAEAPVDVLDAEGRSPLQKAVEWFPIAGRLVGPLIEAGAEVNRQTPEGKTILGTAVDSGRTEMVRLLLYTGAEASAEEKSGWDMDILRSRCDDWRQMNVLLTVYLGEPPRDSLRDAMAPLRELASRREKGDSEG